MVFLRSKATHPHSAYPLLIIAWGVLAYGVSPLLKIGTAAANSVAASAVLIGAITTIVALVQIWRHY